MKVVEVLPIARGVFRDRLSYFAKEPPMLGSLLEVNVRGKKVPAIITAVTDAAAQKTSLRGASFQLKKLPTASVSNFLLPSFLDAARRASDHFASSLGQVLKSVVSQPVLDRYLSGKEKLPTVKKEVKRLPRKHPELFALQEPEVERLAFYKSLIRSEFARNASVFLILPTVAEIEHAATLLEKGIREYMFILHSKLGSKVLWENWRDAVSQSHPVLVLATPAFLSLPRADLGSIVFDRESSGSYKQLSRPFLDYRRFGEFFASALGCKIYFGDTLLRSETNHRVERGEIMSASPLKHRAFSPARQEIIPFERETGEEFRPVTARLEWLLAQAMRRGERSFFLVNRRGTSPLIICRDCGESIRCRRCANPMVLHRFRTDGGGAAADYRLVCHKCRETRAVEERCRNCGGWRLEQLGIAIEGVELALKKLVPDLEIFRLDSDLAPTGKKAKEIISRFFATPGACLLGTELALHYLKDKVENVAVVSLDGLFTIPDFRIGEKAFNLLLRARELATKQFLVQTKHGDWPFFEQAMTGNLLEFYRKEITDRERFGYPPFKLLLKITREGKRLEILPEIQHLATSLNDYEPETFPAFTSEVKGEYIMHLLLKLEPKRWPEEELLASLKALPPRFIINVEPETIL